MMFSSFFLIFLALPTPLKVAVMAVGGFFWMGAKVEHRVMEAPPAAMEAQPLDEPRVVPARPAQPVPVKPAVEVAKAYVVSVQADGSCRVEGKKVTEAELVQKLKAVAKADPKRRLLITADTLTPHQVVVGVVKHCKSAGLTNISFATKSAKPKAP